MRHLFFGYPQLYVSQVRSGPLWPTQVEALRTLYLAPFTPVLSVAAVWVSPFTEEFTAGAWLLMLARFAAVVAAVVLIAMWRRRPFRAVLVVGAYVPLTVGLAAAGLGN
jgi:hypothetical protein